MGKLLEGKTAIITGAGGGIGKATAIYFAREGARVVVNDLGGDRHGQGRARNAADAVVEEILSFGGEAIANYDTVATLEGAYNMVFAAVSKWGRLDILVNNAGILRDRTFLNMSDDEWKAVLDVHLYGAYYCSKAAARQMRAQNSGAIVNTTSLSGMMGNFGQANYSAAKAGIYGLTRVLAMELERFNIRVNAIAPVAKTRMTEDLPNFKNVSEEILGPQHVAPVTAFLASDWASDINGQVVGVQGGKLFVYKVETSAGVTHENQAWRPEDIRARWSEISK
ncbi:MAG: putative short-chain type dehydrogenase/reductase [Myxococcota bacterium]|nr:putative short-chain type dehydrogenase/reductase [Myxococcota bacterium]